MASSNDGRSLGQMFAELSRETRTLIQYEIQLAKTELTEKASRMSKAAAFIVGGGLLALVGAVVLVLIAFGLPPWAGALLGGIVVAGAGYLIIRSGLSMLGPQDLTPRETIATLKEDAQWLKSQTR